MNEWRLQCANVIEEPLSRPLRVLAIYSNPYAYARWRGYPFATLSARILEAPNRRVAGFL